MCINLAIFLRPCNYFNLWRQKNFMLKLRGKLPTICQTPIKDFLFQQNRSFKTEKNINVQCDWQLFRYFRKELYLKDVRLRDNVGRMFHLHCNLTSSISYCYHPKYVIPINTYLFGKIIYFEKLLYQKCMQGGMYMVDKLCAKN